MKRTSLLVAAAVLASLLAAGSAWAFGVKDVLQMHRDGISDSLILQKIQHSGKNFDLNANDMRRLKSAGISDDIVSAMLATEDRYHGGWYPGPYSYPYGPRVVVGLSYYGRYGWPYHGFYGPRPYGFYGGRRGFIHGGVRVGGRF